jgi:hypothetical protein
MTLPSGVRYSVLRNDVEVPLVPVDQLPFYIQGLPRELTPFRKHQEGWKSIGETQEPAVPLSIRAPPSLHSGLPSADTNRQFLPPDHDARRGPVVVSQGPKTQSETHPLSIVPAEGRLTSLRMEGITAARSEGVQYPLYRLPNPSGIEPDPSKKEFCTHWIRTNSCDFMQQGCKYKHEMPDRKKLKELGFAEIPKWYRDKMAISAGASSWLRPRATQDNNDRQLSIEPPASRAFLPSISGLDRSQSRAAEPPGPAPPRTDQPPVELPNLIDLDDYSMATVSLIPLLSVNSSPDAVSSVAEKIVRQPSEEVTKTLASSLRQEGLEARKLTNAPIKIDKRIKTQAFGRDTVLVADAILTKDVVDSPAKTPSRSVGSSQSNRREASKQNNTASEATKRVPLIAGSSAAMGPGDKRNSKSSKPQQKRSLRPLKLSERAAASPTPDGLAKSHCATGRKSREGNSPSKGLKRGGFQVEGKDLQFEIMQRQRAGHEKRQFSKGVTSNDS